MDPLFKLIEMRIVSLLLALIYYLITPYANASIHSHIQKYHSEHVHVHEDHEHSHHQHENDHGHNADKSQTHKHQSSDAHSHELIEIEAALFTATYKTEQHDHYSNEFVCMIGKITPRELKTNHLHCYFVSRPPPPPDFARNLPLII